MFTRWLFNLSPVATLLISKLFGGEMNWYRLPGRTADILQGTWEGDEALGRGGTDSYALGLGNNAGAPHYGACHSGNQTDTL